MVFPVLVLAGVKEIAVPTVTSNTMLLRQITALPTSTVLTKQVSRSLLSPVPLLAPQHQSHLQRRQRR